MTGGGHGPRQHDTHRDDYCSPDVFAAERERFFNGGWFYACHADSLPPSHRRVVDIAGESVIVTRDAAGVLHAHANVCRHRGSRLCDAAEGGAPTPGAIRCPYHAWTYSLDGSFAPRHAEDALDRSTIALWRHHVAEWNGLIFVSLADSPPALAEWLADHTPDLATFDALRIDALVVGARTETVVRANWKIIVENYLECLHCAVVHPELVEILPLYSTATWSTRPAPTVPSSSRRGQQLHRRRTLEVVGAARHRASRGQRLSVGCAVFPNVLLDVTGTSASLTSLFPIDQSTTVVAAEYLFAADDVVRRLRPGASRRVQRARRSPGLRGVRTRPARCRVEAFTTGILTDKDRFVAEFIAHYRATFAAAP